MILPMDLYMAMVRAGHEKNAKTFYPTWVEDPGSMQTFASAFIHSVKPGTRLMDMIFEIIFSDNPH